MGKIFLAFMAAAGLGLLPDLPARPGRTAFPPPTSTPHQQEQPETATDLEGLVRLPPLVSPGEVIEFTPLNPARTPPGGRWLVAGVEARPVAQPEEDSEPPRLRVQLPLDLHPMGPLQ